jgi:RNA polymerase sigma factor (sigma-70 family)
LVTARYAIFDYLRYLYRQVKLIQRSRSTDNEGSDPDDSIDLKTLTCIWHAIIRRLPSQQRSVYELVEMQGLSLDEVAGQLGLQKETIKSYLKLARKCVRQEMYQEMRAGGFSGEYTLAIIFLLFF